MDDEVVKRILDSSKWPNIENPEGLSVLNELADNAYNLNTFEGYISAILIYHQLIESMIIHLLEDCYFFIQLCVYPLDYACKINKNKMLGVYIKELKDTLEFENKEEFIFKCIEFNKLRNEIVHGITKQKNLNSIIKDVKTARSIFDHIYELYDETQDWFRVCFKDMKKDTFIDIAEEEDGED